MKELSLFSGAGGGLLGTKLLGWNHIGYVEFNKYCQQVIAQRIKDGILDEAPIFTDVREFLQSGAARQYRGFVDVVTAGFPCQPFSVAGKQKGKDDERNMWPATIGIIREVRPRLVFMENVPGLLSNKYIGTIFGEMAEAGYDIRWCVLSAKDCGAPHVRKRMWIIGEISNSHSSQCERRRISSGIQEENTNFSGGSWWETEPDVGRVANGVASGSHRLKAIGNGQVPAVVATAWRILND